MVNANVALKLRLKLFQSVVTPTVLFGLCALPLTQTQLRHLDCVQRRMLRSIVGWVRFQTEDWSTTMTRMNGRLDYAQQTFPIQPWSQQFAARQFSFAQRITKKPDSWPAMAIAWDPFSTLDLCSPIAPWRSRGRPRRKWDDYLRRFAADVFPNQHWFQVSSQAWAAKQQDFLSMFT